MIIAKTRLRKIPEKCLKCKFCQDTGKISRKSCKETMWVAYAYRIHRCLLTGADVPLTFNSKKHDFEHTKCKTCPLEDVEVVI